ncbi:MAG TPA: hypothetical protein PLA80_13430, partial [Synergistaceae bacterium]|nr:hypothetical protein [Synergistaceae bacterium]
KGTYAINDSLFYEGTFQGRVETYICIKAPREEMFFFRRTFLYSLLLFGSLFLLLLLPMLHGLLRQPLLQGQEELSRFTKADSLTLWRRQARKSSKNAEKELSPKLFSFALSRRDEIGKLFASLQQFFDFLHGEIFQQEKNMEALESNNTRLIEELCVLREEIIEKEQHIRELEKKIRLFDEKNRNAREGKTS